jgi:hypothetical protein
VIQGIQLRIADRLESQRSGGPERWPVLCAYLRLQLHQPEASVAPGREGVVDNFMRDGARDSVPFEVAAKERVYPSFKDCAALRHDIA